jgi:gluconolactonase
MANINNTMTRKFYFFGLSALLCGPVAAQGPPAGRGRGFPQYGPPREVTVTAIAGVIDAGAKWNKVWQGEATADGIVGAKDGGLLFAQEQTNKIVKLDRNNKASDYLTTPHGPGAITFGPKDQILVVERTCTDPGGHLGVKPADCTDPTGVVALTPTRKVLASSVDGKSLGRVNDLVASKTGDVYFTSGGLFHMSPDGKVAAVGQDLRTNGINLSPDQKTLYVTNGAEVVAFDVQPDGSPKNQRMFGKLEGAGDGMTVDAAGRLYVTTPGASSPGVTVLAPDGKTLGVIPTPRSPISVAFSGPKKRTLYVAMMGETLPNGQEYRTAEGVRNTAMTVYTIPVLAQGLKGSPK